MSEREQFATHCSRCAELARQLSNMKQDLECAQTNFRVTNQAYCKLDVETRELRGSSFVPDGLDEHIAAHEATIAPSATASAELAVQELWNIVNAKRFDRERFQDDTEFADWARNRCQFTLGKINAAPQVPESASLGAGTSSPQKSPAAAAPEDLGPSGLNERLPRMCDE